MGTILLTPASVDLDAACLRAAFAPTLQRAQAILCDATGLSADRVEVGHRLVRTESAGDTLELYFLFDPRGYVAQVTIDVE